MKLITKTLLILYLLLIPAQSETNKLVVYTYDSFVAEWGPWAFIGREVRGVLYV